MKRAEMKFRCHAVFRWDQMGDKVMVRCSRRFNHGRSGKPTYHWTRIMGIRRALIWEGKGIGTPEQFKENEAYLKERYDAKDTFGYPPGLVL
jgi:hypothetical protein